MSKLIRLTQRRNWWPSWFWSCLLVWLICGLGSIQILKHRLQIAGLACGWLIQGFDSIWVRITSGFNCCWVTLAKVRKILVISKKLCPRPPRLTRALTCKCAHIFDTLLMVQITVLDMKYKKLRITKSQDLLIVLLLHGWFAGMLEINSLNFIRKFIIFPLYG